MNDIEILKSLIGQTISSVEVSEDEDSVSSVTFSFDDGTELTLSPTSYNYGSQHLTIEST